jgi:hypothetical protein
MESKGALQSVGVWGSLISLVPAALELVARVADSGALGPNGVAVAAAVGGLLSLWGRLKAKKKIEGLV